MVLKEGFCVLLSYWNNWNNWNNWNVKTRCWFFLYWQDSGRTQIHK